jgi:mannose-6-phosphate isomerase-like protein (cupin superfamily)
VRVKPSIGKNGAVIENARTGEQVRFVSESPDLLVMDVVWPRPGLRALEHVHPNMEERWHVLEGRAAFRIDGVEVEAAAGSTVVAPPGRRHVAWNPTDESVRLRIEMRPALRWAEFTTRFFAGDDPIALLDEFADEVALPAN